MQPLQRTTPVADSLWQKRFCKGSRPSWPHQRPKCLASQNKNSSLSSTAFGAQPAHPGRVQPRPLQKPPAARLARTHQATPEGRCAQRAAYQVPGLSVLGLLRGRRPCMCLQLLLLLPVACQQQRARITSSAEKRCLCKRSKIQHRTHITQRLTHLTQHLTQKPHSTCKLCMKKDLGLCACVCACVCMRACVHMCVRVCVCVRRACMQCMQSRADESPPCKLS